MEIKTIYGAFETTNEMGSFGKCLGYSYDKEVAEELATGKGWYGGNGGVGVYDAIVTEQGIYILKDSQPIDESLIKDNSIFKEKALAKLTTKEREVLGLNT